MGLARIESGWRAVRAYVGELVGVIGHADRGRRGVIAPA